MNMKHSILALPLCLSTLFVSCRQGNDVFRTEGNGAVEVSRIDPTNWYVGLKDPSLQLMVYGPNIREAEVYADGARIDSVVRLDSPNYLLVYLNLKAAARARTTRPSSSMNSSNAT